LRHTGEALKQDTATTISEEIRDDRQISDILRTGLSASGGINFELSYGTYDDFLKAILNSSAWSSEVKYSAATISAVAFDNSIHDSASQFVTKGYQPNQWVKLSGFSTTGNNGWAKIVSVDPDEMVLSHITLTDEAAGSTVTIQMGGQIVNGTEDFVSWNVERQYIDLTPDVFSVFLGMCLNTLSLDIPADGIITGSLTFMGSKEESKASSYGTGYSGATVTKVMTGVNHVDQVLEGESEIGILSFSMSVTNNLRQRMQVGTLGVVDMGMGTIEISGSVSLYLTDATLFDKYLNQTPTSFAIAFTDTDGNSYLIELPALKLVDGTRPAGGLNTDVVGEFEWRAYLDSSEGITVRIARFPTTTGDLAGTIAAISSTIGDVTVT
jgi:hypothetical protein